MSTCADIIAYASAAIVAYYLILFLVSLRTTRSAEHAAPLTDRLFVVVVPAHDEDLVIGQTVTRLRALRGASFLALIMNDGSGDATGAVARQAAEDDARICVVDRPHEVAGQGKGEVLNDAYRRVVAMVASDDERLGGRAAADIVLCVVDADGWLSTDALERVAPLYDDARVAGVQIPVRIWNSRESFLALMQDLEFIGFSFFVQGGRDPFGSVGLGGNGQFVRLSALQTVGRAPWTSCLTEDLDLGLRLVERGWRNRFCASASVSQQALNRFRPFFRQRTRWIQGHYSCWTHLPSIWRSARTPLRTKVDLSLYLVLVAFIMVLAVQMSLGVASAAGWITYNSGFLGFVHDEHVFRAVTLGLSIGPLLAFAYTYQRHAARPLPLWALPGVLLLFAAYGYFWAVPASLRALGRIVLKRRGWVKTPRSAVAPDALLSMEGLS